MTQEEKAKRYDEALERAKKYKLKEDLIITQDLFPELAESEDEKIRKEILDYIIKGSESLYDVQQYGKERFEKWIAWLEKQGDKSDIGISSTTKQKLKDNLNKALQKETCDSWNEFLDEQNPMTGSKFKVGDKVVHKGTGKTWTVHWYIKEDNTYSVEDSEGLINIYSPDVLEPIEQKPAWSEEDNIMVHDIDYALRCQITYPKSRLDFMSSWIYNLKNRVQPQTKQEWSGGDEAHLHSLITHLEQWIERHPNTTGADIQGENIAWLKSLRPQNTWKPSEEMLEALYRAIPENVMEISEDEMLLDKLYQGLKYGRVLSKD